LDSSLRVDLDELNIKIRDLELTSFPSTLSINEAKKRKAQLSDIRSQYNLLRNDLFKAAEEVFLMQQVAFFNKTNRRS